MLKDLLSKPVGSVMKVTEPLGFYRCLKERKGEEIQNEHYNDGVQGNR